MYNYELVALTSSGIKIVNDEANVQELNAIVENNEGYAYLYGELCRIEVRHK